MEDTSGLFWSPEENLTALACETPLNVEGQDILTKGSVCVSHLAGTESVTNAFEPAKVLCLL